MEFLVGFTVIIWLLVAIIAFGTRPASAVEDAEEKFGKRSINHEK